jgi:hypothetical protein
MVRRALVASTADLPRLSVVGRHGVAGVARIREPAGLRIDSRENRESVVDEPERGLDHVDARA